MICIHACFRKKWNFLFKNINYPLYICAVSGPVVQWIERQIPVLKVGGSSPSGITTRHLRQRVHFCFM